MNARAFTLVELIIVISIMSILTTIAVFNWNRMTTKGNIEGQIKTAYSDLMTVRSEALYCKRNRSVVISGNQFMVYSSNFITSTPISTKSFKFNFVGATTITFDNSGMTNGVVAICVDPSNTNNMTLANDAAVDSLVVSQAMIWLGKRGTNCDSTITQK